MSWPHIAKMLKFHWWEAHFEPVLETASLAVLDTLLSCFISSPLDKCTLIFDDFRRSAFTINPPVILSISLNIQNKHNAQFWPKAVCVQFMPILCRYYKVSRTPFSSPLRHGQIHTNFGKLPTIDFCYKSPRDFINSIECRRKKHDATFTKHRWA